MDAVNLFPLVAIVGETGSGKSALGLALAERFDGEIICADSRTVYKGMDIGTAKPTPEERRRVIHYGLDIVEPSQVFSAFDFQQLATATIDDIGTRGKLPIIVGGTGLYIDSVLYSYSFRAKPDAKMRGRLEGIPVAELQRRVLAAGLPLPENSTNRRHLTRLLESGVVPSRHVTLRPQTLVLGLSLPTDVLRQRITQRVEAMVASGFIDEVGRVQKRYGDVEALRAPGYKAFVAYLTGDISLEKAKWQFVQNDMQLARRQRTWFKRNKAIHWLQPDNAYAEAVGLITPLL